MYTIDNLLKKVVLQAVGQVGDHTVWIGGLKHNFNIEGVEIIFEILSDHMMLVHASWLGGRYPIPKREILFAGKSENDLIGDLVLVVREVYQKGKEELTAKSPKGKYNFPLQKNDDYSLLGVAKNAPWQDIKRAYKSKLIKLHPDHNPNDDTTEQMKAVNVAYDRLKKIYGEAFLRKMIEEVLTEQASTFCF